MNIIESIFKSKIFVPEKLLQFGFLSETPGIYVYRTVLPGCGFIMQVCVNNGVVSAILLDPEFGEPYTLHLTESAVGSFVGGVKQEFENCLITVANKCCNMDVFKFQQTKDLIAYADNTYGSEPEHLWDKFPENAILRRSDNKKWYAAILTVSKKKLGLPSDEVAEIIDLREKHSAVASLVDGVKYFPGWHMNKKSWYTVILDGSVPNRELFKRIDASYTLANK